MEMINRPGRRDFDEGYANDANPVPNARDPPPQVGRSVIGTCVVVILSYILLVCTLPFSLLLCLKICQAYEEVVIFRLGTIRATAKEGLFFILPCVDHCSVVDKRTVSFDVPRQEVLTKDSVTITVDAVVFFKIQDSICSILEVKNAAESTKLLAMTTLRNELGGKSLSDILGERAPLSRAIQRILDEATDLWGVKVERVEIKDVHLPVMMQDVMAAEARAQREGQAKVIHAEKEVAASVRLKEASEVLSETPTALKLRYLQTLQSISAEKSATIVFPIPMDMLPESIHISKN